MSSLPPDVRRSAERLVGRLCRSRIPVRVRDHLGLSYTIRGSSVTIFEDRPRWNDDTQWITIAVAQLRYDPLTPGVSGKKKGSWTLYYHGRNRWLAYPDLLRFGRLWDLIEYLDEDQLELIWG